MTGPNGTNGVMTAQLNQLYWAVEYMANLDGQDHLLVIEMSQAMLNDLIERNGFAPMADYVRKYCDVLDSAEDADEIAADIAAGG